MAPLLWELKSSRMDTNKISWEERTRPERDFLKERRLNVILECHHNLISDSVGLLNSYFVF